MLTSLEVESMAQRREDSELTNLRRLALFLQVADAESFSRASVQSGVSQPVLSRYVGALEREVGARVFYRDGRGVRLTEAGLRLQVRVKNIMAELSAARLELADAREGASGKAVLGVQPAVGSLLTVPIASRSLRELPNVRVHIMEGLSAHILEWLHSGRIDIALHYDQPNISRANSDSILEQDLLLVGPKESGMSLEGTVPASRLAELTLILPGKPHGLRLILDALALRNGFALNVPLEIDSAPSIVGLVAGGLGYSVLPLNSILDAYRAGHVTASWIAKPRITRNLMMTIASHRPLTPTVRRIVQIIRQEARKVSAAAQQVRVATRRAP